MPSNASEQKKEEEDNKLHTRERGRNSGRRRKKMREGNRTVNLTGNSAVIVIAYFFLTVTRISPVLMMRRISFSLCHRAGGFYWYKNIANSSVRAKEEEENKNFFLHWSKENMFYLERWTILYKYIRLTWIFIRANRGLNGPCNHRINILCFHINCCRRAHMCVYERKKISERCLSKLEERNKSLSSGEVGRVCHCSCVGWMRSFLQNIWREMIAIRLWNTRRKSLLDKVLMKKFLLKLR